MTPKFLDFRNMKHLTPFTTVKVQIAVVDGGGPYSKSKVLSELDETKRESK